MNINTFYTKSQTEIVELLRDFIKQDFFLKYPQYADKLSLIITGSVALGVYDRYSDMDVEFCFEDEKDREELAKIVKAYKQSLKKRKISIQFHPSKTFEEIRVHQVSDWNKDDALREYATALVVRDPSGSYATLQKKIAWYPKDVYKEKMQWLFAEVVFTYADRWKIANQRKNVYYAEAMKIQVMRLLGNALLMLNKQYPSFDKHLRARLQTCASKKFLQIFDRLLEQKSGKGVDSMLKQLLSLVETELIQKKLAPKKDQLYWMDLRPKFRVEILSR